MLVRIGEEVIAGLFLSCLSILGIVLKKIITQYYYGRQLTNLHLRAKKRLELLQNHNLVTRFQSKKLNKLLAELYSISQQNRQFTKRIDKYYTLLQKADELEINALEAYYNYKKI